ncbi:MAG: restriction endonuclease, SacI family [Dehalococcoidia bacterium]|nr:restriction endonuclease, SacI family [Dehalococcoidia bacterium]MDW8009278.1 restriction endonuclease, SacI family [Chloroflexota bacterium]
MARRIDYRRAAYLLEDELRQAETDYSRGAWPSVPDAVVRAADVLFATSTQSFREALLGCAVARVLDPDIDITLPYSHLADNAFSGRGLDERVINPLLQKHQIPCSKGAYLAVFRRSVPFDESIVRGLKDKEGYRAFLFYLAELKRADTDTARALLRYLLLRFIDLREKSIISLVKPRRLALEQWQRLVEVLLDRPSGGQLPVLLAVALLKAVSGTYGLGWDIQWQPINAPDAPSGAAGDITVYAGEEIYLALEVTERSVDENRVRSTFHSKIAPQRVGDFLFLFSQQGPTSGAFQAARQYLMQDYEIGFVPVKEWIICNLSLAGAEGRRRFLQEPAQFA